MNQEKSILAANVEKKKPLLSLHLSQGRGSNSQSKRSTSHTRCLHPSYPSEQLHLRNSFQGFSRQCLSQTLQRFLSFSGKWFQSVSSHDSAACYQLKNSKKASKNISVLIQIILILNLIYFYKRLCLFICSFAINQQIKRNMSVVSTAILRQFTCLVFAKNQR